MSKGPSESLHERVGADAGEVITACDRQRELARRQRLVARGMRERIRSQRADLDRYRRFLDECRRSLARPSGLSAHAEVE